LPQSDDAARNLAVLSRPDAAALAKQVAKARSAAKVRSIERSSKLAAWNDYIGFAVSKVVGVGALVAGTLECVDPNFLSVVVPRPGLVLGAGLALLTGRNIVSLIARLERSNK